MKINSYYFITDSNNTHFSHAAARKSNALNYNISNTKTIPAQATQKKLLKSPAYSEFIFGHTFKRNVSFKSNNINNSLDDFIKWSNETDFLSHARKIVEKTGKILGSGFEGITYLIPD